MTKKEHFISKRIKSIRYAFNGAFLLLKTEASIKIQFVIALIITALGFYYNISTTEWIVQILSIGLVMSIESLNTAIEKISDFIHPEHNTKIGFIKDIAAGAVFIASVFAILIGFIIYLPKVF